MSVETYHPIPIEEFGGLITVDDPSDVPDGYTPDARDVQFLWGGCMTRPRVATFGTPGGLGDNINYLKTYVTSNLTYRLLAYVDDGELAKETTPGVFASVATGLSGSVASSTTLFGKEWIAFSNGKVGAGGPKHYDDTNLDPVGVAGPITSPTPTETANPGNIPAGLHRVIVWFETRSGYWTVPDVTDIASAASWTAAGSLTVNVTSIPVSPDPQVTKRLLAFTAVGGASFFHVPATMVLNDNVTTSLEVDFDEATLLSGQNVDYLFRLIVLPPQLGVIDYNTRLFWWGNSSDQSLVRASLPEDPESYDSLTGIMKVAENNGQAIRNAFKIRSFLYFVKERSLHVTGDDGVNEPNNWGVEEVSNVVGTPSIRGVGYGEEWVVIASRGGLYFFNGGDPIKLSQDIQPLWGSIKWDVANVGIWVVVDPDAQRILVGVPINPAPIGPDPPVGPNQVLYLDYSDGEFSDPVRNKRKWCPWWIPVNVGAFIERSDGSKKIMFGTAAQNGKVLELDDSSDPVSDTGDLLGGAATAINSFYRTYFVSSTRNIGRQLMGKLTAYVRGAGTLLLKAFGPGDVNVVTPGGPALTLSDPAKEDLERKINVRGERVSFKFETNAVGAWFSVTKAVVWAKTEPYSVVRGKN